MVDTARTTAVLREHAAILEGCRVCFFGSALTTDDPGDLDVIVIYSPIRVSPSVAHKWFADLFRDLRELTKLKVHVSLLTEGEEEKKPFHVARPRRPVLAEREG